MEDVAVVLYVFAALPLVDVYAGRCADKDSCAHHVELCIGRVSSSYDFRFYVLEILAKNRVFGGRDVIGDFRFALFEFL